MTRRLLPLLFALVALPAGAATYVVGTMSLDQAILASNANPGRDRIEFAADVFAHASMPPITDVVDIDGSAAPSGRHLVSTQTAFETTTFFRFQQGSSGSTLRDLRFAVDVEDDAVIVDDGVNGITLTGNAFDGKVRLFGDGHMVGGPTAEEGNSFTLDQFFRTPLEIWDGADSQVLSNTSVQIHVRNAQNIRIGAPGQGNDTGGVIIEQSPGTIIEGNTVREILSVSQSVPGPAPRIIGNVVHPHLFPPLIQVSAPGTVIQDNILHNPEVGIRVLGTGISITGNTIFGGSGFARPISFDTSSPVPNDPSPDADTGPNNLQNHPVLTSASLFGTTTLVVTGILTSAPSTLYQIELFSNEQSDPQARTLLASFFVTTDATGSVEFSRTIGTNLPTADEVITSTATSRGLIALPGNGINDTSEVSAPIAIAQLALHATPTLATWALIALALGLATLALFRPAMA